MDDIAPELLEAIRKDFIEILGEAELRKLNYLGAQEYAEEVGAALAEAFRRNIRADSLPQGRLWWNLADRVIRPMLEENHRLVADAAQAAQQALNKAAGLGLKAQRAPLDEDRVSGILNRLATAEDFSEVAWLLDEPVRTFSRSVVDDTLQKNVDFQGKAGLRPKVIRTAESHCCKWCAALAGVYEYPDVPKDVYRRHERCRCDVEYDPGDAKRRQNVHTKKWRTPEQIEEQRGKARAEHQAAENLKKQQKEKRIRKSAELKQENLDKMSLPQLRKLAKETAAEYYKSGLSGISFGNHDMEKAAEALANQGSRTSLKKDIRAMRKKMDKSDTGRPDSGIIKARGDAGESRAFHSLSDPLADVMGPGEISHPAEIDRFRTEIKECGAHLIEADEEKLAYSPGIARGEPGTVYVSKGASYSAWSHEMQHMWDDRDAGWSGMRILMDRDERYRREKRAYNLEIEIARSIHRPDVVKILENNLEAERREIYGEKY